MGTVGFSFLNGRVIFVNGRVFSENSVGFLFWSSVGFLDFLLTKNAGRIPNICFFSETYSKNNTPEFCENSSKNYCVSFKNSLGLNCG